MSDVLTRTVGVVGARGYVGEELMRLLTSHPALNVSLACSRSRAGEVVHHAPALRYLEPDAAIVAKECPDVLILAMPNGAAAGFLADLTAAGGAPEVVIDLSADMRFNDSWVYSIPELHADRAAGAQRIANPGCYATAMQLTLAPLGELLDGMPYCFGVSGYSGAGSTPNPRNDLGRLEGGILPYALNGHIHEQEVSRHLGRSVRFAPNVAPFPRGIVLTALCSLREPMDPDALVGLYERAYASASLIDVVGAEMPRVQEIVGTHGAVIGGIDVNHHQPVRVAVVCIIDNLLKGAASQAVQNLNLALGLNPLMGISS